MSLDAHARAVLPIPDRTSPGLKTYDHVIELEERLRIAMARQ